MNAPRTFAIKSFGCQMNVYDGERMAELLAAQGIRAAVVSAPSFELFASQARDYRTATLGTAPRVGVEAAIRQGWDGPILRTTDAFVGMTGFGASAPAERLYQEFGITAEAVAAAAKAKLG